MPLKLEVNTDEEADPGTIAPTEKKGVKKELQRIMT